MDALTVLIVDDHQFFRDGVRALLDAQSDMEYVGEATTGEEAIRLSAEMQPDVVLMDVHMPGMGGVDATHQIMKNSPQIRVLVVTMFEDDHLVFAAMRAGARGYLLKGVRHEDMVRAIRAVGNGDAIFSPAIATKLVSYFSTLQPAHLAPVFPELSQREREILALLAQGCKNAEIAERLVVSPKSVRNYVSNVISKLQVADRAQAILRAKDAGLGK
ncbi:response regulator [Ktedonobacter racemifer]|uniref:Two component transcriptional regulator, LuxR family n=1 Tax=Ktedonobacter racemifer DSM 44963 TaxID=485913 RepID=D6TCX0_KTERA|nr:response regulator transcription factor [Ktedonobacter racemifer]EFH88234.1 two component transcriptional regulator, LuxR family [Ktedonobacter racemifer DSM 44963]